MHLAASIPNFLVLEQIEPDRDLRNRASSRPIELVDGHFDLPEAPGLGIDPVFEALQALPKAEAPRRERRGSLFHLRLHARRNEWRRPL